jgi:hypothetical protein
LARSIARSASLRSPISRIMVKVMRSTFHAPSIFD